MVVVKKRHEPATASKRLAFLLLLPGQSETVVPASLSVADSGAAGYLVSVALRKVMVMAMMILSAAVLLTSAGRA